MTDVVKVTNSVRNMLSFSEEESFEIIPTVRAVCLEIYSKLKDKKDENDPRIINACVFLSNYRIILSKVISGETIDKFRAGDVTVTKSPSLMIEKAAQLRDNAICDAYPLLEDHEFVFRQV